MTIVWLFLLALGGFLVGCLVRRRRRVDLSADYVPTIKAFAARDPVMPSARVPPVRPLKGRKTTIE